MNRRAFLRTGVALGVSLALSACKADVTPSLPVSPTPPGALPSGPWGDVPPGTLLDNENVPGFYVRFINRFPAIDPGRWQLTIKGLVESPTTMTLDHIRRNLPFVEQNTRMKCVECWSSRATWGGFTLASLAALVKPLDTATHLYFACEDGYYEILPLSELRKERALFVTHMDGQPLGAKYGAPLRVIVPWLYGYKGAKTIHTLEFRATGGSGYWSDVGPYSVDGLILPGVDTPLDLGGGRRRIGGGEITDY